MCGFLFLIYCKHAVYITPVNFLTDSCIKEQLVFNTISIDIHFPFINSDKVHYKNPIVFQGSTISNIIQYSMSIQNERLSIDSYFAFIVIRNMYVFRLL